MPFPPPLHRRLRVTLQRLCCAWLLVMAACVTPTRAETIRTHTLDRGSGLDAGRNACLVTVNGNPATAYSDFADQSLMFARNSAPDGSGTWERVVVARQVRYETYCSLAVIAGRPAIAYISWETSEPELRYVRANDANGSSWGTPVRLGSGFFDVSLTEVNGHPAIASEYSELRYVRANDAEGATWGSPRVVMRLAGGYILPSSRRLAVVDGKPAICTFDQDKLHYVRALDANGDSWGEPVTLDHAAGYCNLVVVGGNPAIGYEDNDHQSLNYVRATDAGGTAWDAPVAIATTSGWTAYCSLAVVDGRPAFSYADRWGALKYVRAADAVGATWGTPSELAPWYPRSVDTSLAVIDGAPAIAFRDGIFNSLRFVRASDADGMDWAAPVIVDDEVSTGDVGSDTAQVLVNGNPAIAYSDRTNDTARFVRALDPSGTTWSAPVTIAGRGSNGVSSLAIVNGNPAVVASNQYVRATNADGTAWSPAVMYGAAEGGPSSLAVVNGAPAISFSGHFGELRYVRASDPDGLHWGDSLALTDGHGGIAGQSGPLRVVDGKPATVYFDLASGTLKFLRATDADGTAWAPPVTIDGTYDSGRFASLEIIGGCPAIAYLSENRGELRYVRAMDASGTTWAAPVKIVYLHFTEAVSLSFVGGLPTVAYYDSSDRSLKCVRAMDAAGTAWQKPFTVDAAGDVGKSCSLLEVAGAIAVSYYDESEGDLKWATVRVEPIISGTFAQRTIAAGELLPDYRTEAVVTDANGPYSLTQDPPPGSVAVQGFTSITLTAIDSLGRTGDFSFTIEVRPAHALSRALLTLGDPAPGSGMPGGPPADATLTYLGDPAIDDASTVVFSGKWVSPRAGSGSGIFTPTECLAITDAPAPGGGKFKAFGDPMIDDGHVLFFATVVGRPAFCMLVHRPPGGPLAGIVDNDRTVGTGIADFQTFRRGGVSGGSVAFIADFSRGNRPAHTGLWAADGMHVPTLRLEEGQRIGRARIKSLTAFMPGNGSAGQGRGWVTTTGIAPRVHALAMLSDRSQALLATSSPTESVTVLSSTGLNGVGKPSLNGAAFSSYSFPALNAAGDHAFLATLRAGSGGVTPATARGIFLNNATTGTYDAVVRTGDAATLIPGATFGTLYDPILASDDASLAFRADLTGVSGYGRSTLWWRPAGGALRLLAQAGQPASETSPGLLWLTFTSLAIAPGRGPIFAATLTPQLTSASPVDVSGVWGVDFAGALRLLFRTGDQIDGRVVTSFSVLKSAPRCLGETRSFNAARQVVWRATFADGKSALVLTTVP